MKQKLLLFILFSFVVFPKTFYCQDVSWKTDPGNLSFLKGGKDLKVEFKYEIETVNENQTEGEFVAEQKKTRNLKNAGMGDKWEKDWFQNRSFLFNPSFVDEFNRKMKKKFLLDEACEGCLYKMVVHIKTIRTGKDNKVSTTFGQIPAGGNFRIEIIDQTQKVLASFEMDNLNSNIVPRNDTNFFPWINQAFGKAGKMVATELLKKL